MIKRFFQFLTIFFCSLSFLSCQININHSANPSSAPSSTPGLSYLILSHNSQTPFAVSLQNTIINLYPEPEFIRQIESDLAPYLTSYYHCFFQTNPSGQIDYTIEIPLQKTIATEQLSHLSSSLYQLSIRNNILVISTSPPATDYSLIAPSTDDLLTIIYFDYYPLISSTHSLTPEQQLNHFNLQQLFSYLPLSIKENNNQIIINQPPPATINPVTATAINFHPQANSIFFQQQFNDLLNTILHPYFLTNNLFSNSAVDIVHLDIDQNNYLLSYQFSDNEAATDIFNTLKNSLSSQNTYHQQTKLLPDNTSSTLYQPDPTSKLTVTTDSQTILFANNAQISLDNQQIIFTNSTDQSLSSNLPNQINFSNLSTIYPFLQSVDYLKSIQFYISDHNQLSGYIIK